jgi:hypothetical protein
MCFVLYMASEKPIRPIRWVESEPRFYVSPNDLDSRNAAWHFTKPHIAFVGSDNGCGCGFRKEHHEMIDDPDQLASILDNQKRLHDYLSECLVDEESVELYGCWAGDETLPKEHDRTVPLAVLLSAEFVFLERQRTVVVRKTGPL